MKRLALLIGSLPTFLLVTLAELALLVANRPFEIDATACEERMRPALSNRLGLNLTAKGTLANPATGSGVDAILPRKR
jgi:hypothetical protein